MTPSLICPSPPAPEPDCGLYDVRLPYSQNEGLRRAILTEHRQAPDLAGLIRTEQTQADRCRPTLPPPPAPPTLPILDHKKGLVHE